MKLKFCILSLILLNSINSILFANSDITVSGKVTSHSGSAIAVVKVIIPELRKQVHSDNNGNFKIDGVKQGEYKIGLRRIGCQPTDTLIKVYDGMPELRLIMSDAYIITDKVVVTGTRTVKQIESNPITTAVIGSETIKKSGSLRLDDVLGEETGLYTVDDHVKGIQIQGLNPDYVLILINGEPLIGRYGGVLDLQRIAAGNIKRVEIVKGPSSSLYGSNALSGVINIITNEPDKPFSGAVSARYGSFNTVDVSAETGLLLFDSKLGINLFANRVSSDGFMLSNTDYGGKAVPAYKNYTFTSDLFYYFSAGVQAKLGFRLNTDNPVNFFYIHPTDSTTYVVDDKSSLKDYNISFSLKHQATERLNLELRAYYAKYATSTTDTYRYNDSLYDKYMFDQSLAKFELQANHMILHSHILTFGGGVNLENVKAERINADGINAHSSFGFVQEDWIPTKDIDIIGSLRYDAHSDYGSHLSPKIAGSYRLFDGFIFKASMGSGFKAPSFEQLYLNWTNPIAGYSVFGSSNFKSNFQKLLDNGVIANVLIPINSIITLKPETSNSYNTGFVYDISEALQVNTNLFRNNLTDMIETLPVATKSNLQQVFTYFNLNQVYTQGLELNFSIYPVKNLIITGGYQYLEAMDEQVVSDIKSGKKGYTTTDSNGIAHDYKVKLSDYGGLFNRSKHSANIKIDYTNPEYGYNANIRCIIKGRYGFSDKNQNQILDADNEYAPAYMLWNISTSKDLPGNLRLQAGINNLFDKYDPHYLVANPGRTFFISLSIKINKD